MIYTFPEDSMVQVSRIVDNGSLEMWKNDIDYDAYLRNSMRPELAEFLLRHKVEKQVGEYTTTYRLRLVVLSPDEMMGLIRKEASRYYLDTRKLDYTARN